MSDNTKRPRKTVRDNMYRAKRALGSWNGAKGYGLDALSEGEQNRLARKMTRLPVRDAEEHARSVARDAGAYRKTRQASRKGSRK
jgi:hypothetical protein